MYISCCYFYVENKIMLVTGCMRFVGKTLLVFTFMEYAGIRIRCRNCYFFLLWRCWIVIIIEWLFVVFFAISVNFFPQLLCISFCFNWNSFSCFFLHVCTCFDMCPIDKNCTRIQKSFLCCCVQYPPKYIFYSCCCKTMLKIIAYCWKMRHLFIQWITDKPPVCNIHIHFFQRPPERWYPIYVLYHYNLKQYYRIDTWPAVVLAVQIIYKFINLFEIYCCIYFPQ